MNTCVMCHSLYVKANGELPCWDDVGEDLILRTLDPAKLKEGAEGNIFHSSTLQYIRQSFFEGRDPHPEYCSRCAVRGHGGGHDSIRPTTMQLLHLEGSYLCHLSCPQCIPSSKRHDLKAPPYHLSAAMLEGLFRQLKNDGVDRINVVHFEGRGDPLMNPEMGQLVGLTKTFYPSAFTMATTHGSYPYKPWVVESGLDLLRVSIDAAFPKSYETYRVGGNLETALSFLDRVREEKQRLRSNLQVDWKYILFEWNDSDEEIAHAVRIATDLDVRLRFVLTHSPGRSLRFQDDHALSEAVRTIAPGAVVERTAQRKGPHERNADMGLVVDEQIGMLLRRSMEATRSGDHEAALQTALNALALDPGFVPASPPRRVDDVIRASVPTLLKKTRFPRTLLHFAAAAVALGDRTSSRKLLRRYLSLVPACESGKALMASVSLRRLLSERRDEVVLWLRLRLRLRTRLRYWKNTLATLVRSGR